MNKYDDKLKKTVSAELKTRVSVIELSNKYIVSRNTIYRWKKENENRVISPSEKDKKIKRLNRQVERLKEIIQIINEANCLPSAPLKEKLYALESIYGNHSVRILCEALDVDRGTFYNHILRNKKTNTWYAKQREILRVAIQKAYDDYGQIFGTGKITSILKEQGYKTCEDTVRRLMSDMGLTSIRQRAKAMYEKERKAYCKNRLNQNFTANGPNEIWISDVTCYSFQEKNYYICVILDLFSRMVVGYRISHRKSTQLAKGTFKMAYEQRKPPEGLIFHTDRGANYKSYTFMSYLKSSGVVHPFQERIFLMIIPLWSPSSPTSSVKNSTEANTNQKENCLRQLTITLTFTITNVLIQRIIKKHRHQKSKITNRKNPNNVSNIYVQM